jgi:pyruvate,orthophosphate dikinase
MAEKFVYRFATGKSEANASMKALLGGKGANLAEMCGLGIPVPPGFTISTEVCTFYYTNGNTYPAGLDAQVTEALRFLEAEMGMQFGSTSNPLLLSIRSGARASMPGMMDTVLNLGLNDKTVQALIQATGNARFAYDAYRRFVQMYGDVVMGVKPRSDSEHDPFEVALHDLKAARNVQLDTDLSADDLKALVATFKTIIRERAGKDFPEDPMAQLWGAVGAVFGSWMNERAIVYRKMNAIPDNWGTAVNVQVMAFGNMGLDCATGVGFSRDAATGERRPNGEYLINAQGEDVVAGIRTPLQLTLNDSRKFAQDNSIAEDVRKEKFPSLEEFMPEVFGQLMAVYERLEKHFRDMQDLEFTIQKGKLFMLQTRNGKRTGYAAVRIAVDMADEGLISAQEAVSRVSPDQLEQVLKPIFDPEEKKSAVKKKLVIARGLPAGPGAATGRVVFSANDAEALQARWKDPVVLVRHETSPEDIKGMAISQGVLTARGGMTSHAAVVGRQMGRVCVVGCSDLDIRYDSRSMNVGGKTVREGDWLSLDGFTGQVIEGRLKTIESVAQKATIEGRKPTDPSDIFYHYSKLMGWCDEFRKLGIRTNADEPEAARIARLNGAQGIGLTRTEHMFFKGDRIKAMREMILSDTLAERRVALSKLLPMQREDFRGIFREMDGYPVTIRTLDPPLHEFLPHEPEQMKEMAEEMRIPVERVRNKVKALTESNPMLGLRGCRLGILFPEITEMQARAIFEAACEVQAAGVKVLPEIMIPLVGHVNELKAQKDLVLKTAEQVFAEKHLRVEFLLGTMIELPRAAITADQIAAEAQFFSFGTNDLTQTGLGLSRDDAQSFLGFYQEHKILPANPFESIDVDGVGGLVRIAVEKSRKVRPNIKLGICGEHGGDPASIHFFHEVGLNYVSCSPPRVPVARLAAAQIALSRK